ncbi:hypothetical protein [Tsukamurella sp. PLM1]|uniref:DUF7373 family lipoprotein n=1 Tax=Tsukamurella sp. PLM1 TaxID=2929795 RepID=UPI00206DEE8C|nr:hypothetical protein [Tsukamurella sp. PLM1]BDH56013.1 hypothetical protein MTP03_09520 [Tsukamurella sp. PLM1]
MKTKALPALIAGAALLAACSTSTGGEATTATSGPASATAPSAAPTVTVPAGLDTGTFPTTTTAQAPLTADRAWLMEGNRMADALIQVNEVDPRMILGGAGLRSFPVLSGDQLSSRVPDATAAAFLARQMKVGMTTTRGDKIEDPTVAMRIGLYRFASAEDATKALEMVQTSTRNARKVTITGTDGVSATEFKPGTVDSYRVEGPFVINISGTAPTTDEATTLVTKAYRLEVPKVQSFKGTPVSEVQKLPSDIEGALARTLPSSNTNRYTANLNNNVYGINGLLHRIRDISNGDVYRKAGVDAVGEGDAAVYRTRDVAAATQLAADLAAINAKTGDPIAAPAQLPDAKCFDRRDVGNKFCIVTAGRWLATMGGSTVTEVQQKAAAQYTILAKNQ